MLEAMMRSCLAATNIGRRTIAGLMLAILAHASTGRADEICRFGDISYEPFFGSGIHMEWQDSSGPRGVRLQIRDNRWMWYDTHSGTGIRCPSCSDDSLVGGLMRFGVIASEMAERLGLPGAGKTDEVLDPARVSAAVWSILDGRIYRLRAIEGSMPISLFGVAGEGRILAIDETGIDQRIAAVALEDGCFAMFGVFQVKNGRQLSLSSLQSLESAIAIEWYRLPPESYRLPFGQRPTEPPASRFPQLALPIIDDHNFLRPKGTAFRELSPLVVGRYSPTWADLPNCGERSLLEMLQGATCR
jgi:hypothetical protein